MRYPIPEIFVVSLDTSGATMLRAKRLRETPRAVLIDCNGTTWWVPKRALRPTRACGVFQLASWYRPPSRMTGTVAS